MGEEIGEHSEETFSIKEELPVLGIKNNMAKQTEQIRG
jgi:hypothetical protein